MKTIIIKAVIYIFKSVLDFIYFLLKLFPQNKQKVLFCSRQSNSTPLDFILIQEELRKRDIEYVNICCHIGKQNSDYIRFAKAFLQSIYHMAVSRVCIIDSYWPAVSMLKHRKEFTVIQIWHSLGKIKKSGYQTLGKKSGRDSLFADILKMHRNYNLIIAGSPVWNRYYCEAFDVTEDKLLNYGLPRMRYLLDTKDRNTERFFQHYPQLQDKKIILYAPTFRRNMKSHWEDIIDEIKDDGYILIIKKHPGESAENKRLAENVFYMEEIKTIDLISVCDYFITDYSSVALEAAVLRKPIYFWIYDYEEYIRNNGVNIDIRTEFAKYAFKDIRKLIYSIKNEVYDHEFIEHFRDRYLPEDIKGSTDRILDLICGIMDKAGD